MYISFNLDDKFYSGTATLLEDKEDLQYLVDLNDSNPAPIQFIVRAVGKNGEWTNDDGANPDLVAAAGSEINRSPGDETGEETLLPGNYYSEERTGGLQPAFTNGEITNEPDDVGEKAV